jgi:hypothetical protein
MRVRVRSTALSLMTFCCFATGACSTTYRIQNQDVERVRNGEQVANLRGETGDPVDFTHYHFVYQEKGKAPLRLKGVESLNSASASKQLAGVETLTAVPGREDRAWQRTLLGGGVGLAAGLGMGFAVSNRVINERANALGNACVGCGGGYLALGTAISGVIGATIGAVVAYFAGAGVGSTRLGALEFFAEPALVPGP